MSGLLVIIPPDWIQLDWNNVQSVAPNMNQQAALSGIRSDVETWLKEANLIPQDSYLLEFKLIDDTYFIVKLG